MAQGENLIVRYGPVSRPWAWQLAGSLWPPLLFAGVRVEHIAPDFRNVRVRLAKSPLTANMFGTQFGGSMFAMTDPFWAMMLSRNLGPGYAVWDQRAEIEFVAPGRTALTTEFTLSDNDVDKVRAEAEGGDKVLRWFDNEIRDRDGVLVARVRKQVCIRRALSLWPASHRTSVMCIRHASHAGESSDPSRRLTRACQGQQCV